LREAIAPLFADDAVIVGPNGLPAARGRDEIAQSYVDFLSSVTIERYEEGTLEIDRSGDTATVKLPWTITYSNQSGTFTERGTDEYELVGPPEWKIARRTVDIRT